MPGFERHIELMSEEEIAAKERDLLARWRLVFDTARPLRQLYVCSFHRYGDAVDTGSVDAADAAMERLNALLRLSSGTSQNGFSLTAMAYSAKWNATDQIPRRALDSGAVGRYGAVDATDGGETARYSLSWNFRRQSAETAFEFHAYAVRSRLDLFSNFTYALDDPVNGDQFLQSERRSLAGFGTSHTWFGNLAGLASTTRLGGQGRFDKLSPVGLYATAARSLLATNREDRIGQGSLGLFVENTLQWHEKLRSIVGLRYDRYRFKVSSDNPANAGSVSDGIASPKLSFIFGPWARTEFFANLGRGFHSNDARGTTQTIAPKSGLATTPVTPLVRTRGFELGVRSEAINGLQSSLALWRLDIDSELLFVGDAGETEPSRASKRSGIEWNNRYVATPRLAFDLDVAVSRARFRSFDPATDLGSHVPGALEKAVSFGVSVRERGPWSGHLHWRYLGPRPLIDDNSVRSASTSLVHARVGYRVLANTRVSLDVFNLFSRKASDIDYYYQSRLRGEVAGVNDVHFHPVEPVAIRLTLTVAL
jgi:outer membrane receptor protein involved in Fe transport